MKSFILILTTITISVLGFIVYTLHIDSINLKSKINNDNNQLKELESELKNSIDSIEILKIKFNSEKNNSNNQIKKLTWELTDSNDEIKKLKREAIPRVIKATVTAYNPRINQCDSTPYTTAFMRKVHPKYVAISDAILKELGWAPGDTIYIEGIGIRVIGDRMAGQKRIPGYHIDMFMWRYKDARKWGIKRNVTVALVNTDGLDFK